MAFNIKIPKKSSMTLEEEILAADKLLRQTSRSYNLQDMAKVYDLYNKFTGETKKDSGCGSCRRKVLNVMSAEWHRLNKLKEDGRYFTPLETGPIGESERPQEGTTE